MTGGVSLTRLVVETVRAPRDVARWLIGLNLSRHVLHMAFLAVTALNALLLSLQLLLDGGRIALMGLPVSPFGLAAVLALSLLATIGSLTLVGRWAGGKARLSEMAVLVIWLQALRVLVQAALLVLTPLGAGVAALLGLVASAAGLYILMNFIMAAHRFEGFGRAVLTFVFAVMLIAVALSAGLAVLGVSPQGSMAHV